MSKEKLISSDQVRAARAYLRWSQQYLADRSGVSAVTISSWEGDKILPTVETQSQVRSAFELAGIEFSSDGGVRRRA